MWCRAAALVLVAVLTAAPAAAQTQLIAGYPDRAARGPAAARGAVIYSHGLASEGEAAGETPFVVDALQEGGWDVFRLQRARGTDSLDGATAALVAAMQRLRGQGYGRLVLIGHSFGGWISLAAARPENGPVDAVVALAPAAYGRRDETPAWPYNASALYALTQAASAGRLAVFLFPDDPFEPGGRAEALHEIFAQRGLDGAVVEQMAGLAGHDAPLTSAFGRHFGPCLRDFIANPHPRPMLACDPPTPSPDAFALPLDLTISSPDRLAGRWYGAYENGREVLFVVEAAAGEAVRAVYAFSPVLRRPGDRGGYTRRVGSRDAATGVVRFAEPDAASVIECRLVDDRRLELAFAARGGGATLHAVLRRLD